MPLLKYTFFAGASLLAILFVVEATIAPARSAAPQDSWSLDVLRKMANHGEMRPFASAAAAGPFTAMPVVTAQPIVASAEPLVPVVAANVTAPPVMDAQAQLVEAEPARPAKKVAARKPKPARTIVVDNARGPFGFFGNVQSW